jgi:hypothetical protein
MKLRAVHRPWARRSPSGKPSPPVMHYLLFKALTVVSSRRSDMITRPMAACAPRDRLQPKIPDTSKDAS